MPYISSVYSIILWFMESKHLQISYKQAPVNELSLIWSSQSSMVYNLQVIIQNSSI